MVEVVEEGVEDSIGRVAHWNCDGKNAEKTVITSLLMFTTRTDFS